MRANWLHPIKKLMAQKARIPGFCDLLGYIQLVEEHIVAHQDGGVSFHFRYSPPDLSIQGDPQVDYVADLIARAINLLGDGYLIETNVISVPVSPPETMADNVETATQWIINERKAQFETASFYESQYVLSISAFKNNDVEKKLTRLAVEQTTKKSPSFSDELQVIKASVNEVISVLESAFRIRPLCADETVQLLAQCITGQPSTLRADPALMLKYQLAADDFCGGMNPALGAQSIKAIAIDSLPSQSYPTVWQSLTRLPIPYRWSLRFVPFSTATASKHLKRFERSWSSKAIGLMGVLKESLGQVPKLERYAEANAESLREAQALNNSGQVRYGLFNSTLILMHHDRDYLETVSQELVNHIRQLSAGARIEDINAADSYLGSLPGHGDYNLRHGLVDSRFISHIFPQTCTYPGQATHPCPYYGKNAPPLITASTLGNRPFLFNLHVGDVGHTAVLGPTGSGKSTLIALMIAMHRRYEGSRVMVLDKDQSQRGIIQALNGGYINLVDEGQSFNPLRRLTPGDDIQLEQALSWLLTIVELYGITPQSAEIKALRDALERLSHEPDEYKNLNYLSVQHPALRSALRHFNQGRVQRLLTGDNTQFSDHAVMGIELGTLLNDTDSRIKIPLIKALFNEFNPLFKDKRPTLLILEEAWLYLREPIFQRALVDWFKTLRKHNVAVIFISQDLSDIANSASASVIQNSCQTRIFLANPAANELSNAKDYRAFGLSDHEITVISEAIPKRDYYYSSPLGKRLFQLGLGPIAKALCCMDPRDWPNEPGLSHDGALARFLRTQEINHD